MSDEKKTGEEQEKREEQGEVQGEVQGEGQEQRNGEAREPIVVRLISEGSPPDDMEIKFCAALHKAFHYTADRPITTPETRAEVRAFFYDNAGRMRLDLMRELLPLLTLAATTMEFFSEAHRLLFAEHGSETRH